MIVCLELLLRILNIFNTLLYSKILDLSKMKAFADKNKRPLRACVNPLVRITGVGLPKTNRVF